MLWIGIGALLVGIGIFVYSSNFPGSEPASMDSNMNPPPIAEPPPQPVPPPPAPQPVPPPTSSGSVKTFTVTGKNFSFSPSTLTVKKGDTVKITFSNSGGIHDFVIDEFNVQTSRINGGQSQTVEFIANKAGSFEYYCSVGTHRQMGMRGTLTVTP